MQLFVWNSHLDHLITQPTKNSHLDPAQAFQCLVDLKGQDDSLSSISQLCRIFKFSYKTIFYNWNGYRISWSTCFSFVVGNVGGVVGVVDFCVVVVVSVINFGSIAVNIE